MDIHTYIHTYVHTCTKIYTHTYIHTTQTYMHTYIYTYTYIIIHDIRNKVTRDEEALLGKEMAESESSHADVGEGEAIAPDDTSE